MHILVTGATGRVGSRLIPRLLQNGDSVRVLVREPEAARALQDQGAALAKGDLLRPASYARALEEIDAVIHLAAFFRGATPAETQAVNLEGTLNLAREAQQAGIARFVFASTNLVYGPGSEDKLFREEDPPNPAAPYPHTKAAAEQALLERHRTAGLDLRTLRLAFVYGEGDPHLAEGLRWFRDWNPLQRIHLLHHADASQALLLAAHADPAASAGQIYNVADERPANVADILRLHGEKAPAEADHREPNPTWLQLVDTRKIREQLGFQPHYPTLSDAVKADAL